MKRRRIDSSDYGGWWDGRMVDADVNGGGGGWWVLTVLHGGGGWCEVASYHDLLRGRI